MPVVLTCDRQAALAFSEYMCAQQARVRPHLLSTRASTSRLGDSLVEALDVLVEAEKISPDLAMKVLAEVRPC